MEIGVPQRIENKPGGRKLHLEITSIVFDCGESPSDKCGYCKRDSAKKQHYLLWKRLDPADYQLLMDRGHRRCGEISYLPRVTEQCCPHYTIRLLARDFVPSKEQRRLFRRLFRYLDGEWTPGPPAPSPEQAPMEIDERPRRRRPAQQRPAGRPDGLTAHQQKRQAIRDAKRATARTTAPVEAPAVSPSVLGPLLADDPRHLLLPDLYQAPAQGPVVGLLQGSAHTLEVRCVPAALRADAHAVYAKYQTTVHSDAPEECTEEQYAGFLCNKKGVFQTTPRGASVEQGAYHFEYRIDGRLAWVGVVDLCPASLSSVYLFYDPEFSFLSPGTLSALFEIEWVRKASRVLPSLQYYYMGYYIHTCPKMRYKARFRPSELLCPYTLAWVPLDAALPLFDSSPCPRLAPPCPRLAPPEVPVDNEIALPCFLLDANQHGLLPSTLHPSLGMYVRDVGPVLATRMLLLLHLEKLFGAPSDASSDEDDDNSPSTPRP